MVFGEFKVADGKVNLDRTALAPLFSTNTGVEQAPAIPYSGRGDLSVGGRLIRQTADDIAVKLDFELIVPGHAIAP